MGGPGLALRGVAADAERTYAVLTARGGDAGRRTTIEARSGEQGEEIDWRTVISGAGGPLVRTKSLVIAAISAHEYGEADAANPAAVRGAPGALVVALDPTTGTIRWSLAFGTTAWSLVSSLAASDDDLLVAGSFAGTLRVGASIVSSGGKSDGFVARLGSDGAVRWLVRMGGPGPDAIQGVATAPGRIAIAGTFTAGADLLGESLPAWDERVPFSDGFVAELDPAGARRWSTTFGAEAEDAVAGVAIDARGRVAVAATARESVRIASIEHSIRGTADGVLAWWTSQGEPGPVLTFGGDEPDGLVAIVAAGDGVAIAGFYAGTIHLGEADFIAGGGDGAFLAFVDPQGVIAAYDVAGAGREEVTALAPLAGGVVAGLAHTAGAKLGAVTLPVPADPLAGAAVVTRPLPAPSE